MKKIVHGIIVLVVLISCISCKKTRKDIIIGEWRVVKSYFDPAVKLSNEDTVDIAKAISFNVNSVYEFTDKGTFMIRRPKTEAIKGKYELKNEDNYLLLNHSEGNTYSRYLILELDENNFKIRLEQGMPVILELKSIRKD